MTKCWLALVVVVVAAVMALAQDAGTSRSSAADLTRARTKVPGNAYKGADQTAMSQTLNRHLQKAEGLERTIPCERWSVAELQSFMATVAQHRNEDLQDIYRTTKDRRKMPAESIDELRAQWENLNRLVGQHPHLVASQQEAHCREAVMWWTHHLADHKRGQLRAQNLTVPLLPEGPKKACGVTGGLAAGEKRACLFINEKNSCDWCHSTQAAHDAGVPGTSVPDGLKKFDGPDDGNPHGWDRKRRCDQDQMPRCQLCEGVGGRAWSDKNEDIDLTPCEIVAEAKDVNMSTVAPPLYSKKWTVRRKDGKQGGYSDTLIGWKKDPFCFSFFPQNDSIPELCYRSEDSIVKYYDIEREATRIDYNIKNTGIFSVTPNITSTILFVQDRMWIMNHLWVVDQCICADPSGNHCTNPPCHVNVHRWNTFETAQYLGREKIGAEWIQDHGTGKSSKIMELDHFILWSHHVWTDPVSRRLVRAWKPFNGLQVYDPEAWTDSIEDPSVFDSPPAKCKKGGAKVRIMCDDDGNHHPDKNEGLDILESLQKEALAAAAQQQPEQVVV
jgi:hypothetical protein